MMTADQFDALAELLRLRQSASREAARLVLVDGLRTGEAADHTGITSQGVSNAVASCQRGIELAGRIVGR